LTYLIDICTFKSSASEKFFDVIVGSAKNIEKLLKRKLMTERWSDGKDRKYADMGLVCFFQYRDEKGSLVSDLGVRTICGLLHSLAPILPKPGMAWKRISY